MKDIHVILHFRNEVKLIRISHMKIKMSRSVSGRSFYIPVRGRELSRLPVEIIDKDCVQTEVADIDFIPVAINKMAMRSCLPHRISSAAFMLNKIRASYKHTVNIKSKYCYASGRVIGSKEIFTRRIE